jgi:uncharacterized membrane protein required for colicin V production
LGGALVSAAGFLVSFSLAVFFFPAISDLLESCISPNGG